MSIIEEELPVEKIDSLYELDQMLKNNDFDYIYDDEEENYITFDYKEFTINAIKKYGNIPFNDYNISFIWSIMPDEGKRYFNNDITNYINKLMFFNWDEI